MTRPFMAPKNGGEKEGEGRRLSGKSRSGWWFQAFFIFIAIWGNDPI